MKNQLLNGALLLSLASCATVPEASSSPAEPAGSALRSTGTTEEGTSAQLSLRPLVVEPTRTKVVTTEPWQDPTADVGAGEDLAIWRDPLFQYRFSQSYLAETDIEPKITLVDREVMEEVMDLLADEEKDEAIELLQRQRGESGNAVFDFTLANLYFQQDEFDRAAVIYQTAVQKFEKFRRAWRNLGLIHVRQSQWEDAIPALTKVLELGGVDALTYGLLGYAYSNVGNHIAAESAYRMANLLDPGTIDWKMGLARSFFKQERYADAVALTKSMIADDPERTDLWLLQANAFLGLEEPMRAAENFELVDRLGASTPDSLNLLGDIYVNQELFDMAAEAYVRAIDLAPQLGPTRALRNAKVLSSRGALDETTRLVNHIEAGFSQVLDVESKKDLLRLRARIAVATGAGEEEAAVLEEIVDLDPLDGEALILLGQHASRNNDPERAIFYYERAANLEDFEADAKVRHAQLLVSQGRYQEGLPLLRRAQQIRPRDNVQEYLEQVERLAQR